jgi:hypothetical protein
LDYIISLLLLELIGSKYMHLIQLTLHINNKALLSRPQMLPPQALEEQYLNHSTHTAPSSRSKKLNTAQVTLLSE